LTSFYIPWSNINTLVTRYGRFYKWIWIFIYISMNNTSVNQYFKCEFKYACESTYAVSDYICGMRLHMQIYMKNNICVIVSFCIVKWSKTYFNHKNTLDIVVREDILLQSLPELFSSIFSFLTSFYLLIGCRTHRNEFWSTWDIYICYHECSYWKWNMFISTVCVKKLGDKFIRGIVSTSLINIKLFKNN
jgi:hypothetical protein